MLLFSSYRQLYEKGEKKMKALGIKALCSVLLLQLVSCGGASSELATVDATKLKQEIQEVIGVDEAVVEEDIAQENIEEDKQSESEPKAESVIISNVGNSVDEKLLLPEVVEEQEPDIAAEVVEKKEPEVIEVVKEKEPEVIEVVEKKEPEVIEVVKDKEPEVIEVVEEKKPEIIEVAEEEEPEVIEVVEEKEPEVIEVVEEKEPEDDDDDKVSKHKKKKDHDEDDEDDEDKVSKHKKKKDHDEKNDDDEFAPLVSQGVKGFYFNNFTGGCEDKEGEVGRNYNKVANCGDVANMSIQGSKLKKGKMFGISLEDAYVSKSKIDTSHLVSAEALINKGTKIEGINNLISKMFEGHAKAFHKSGDKLKDREKKYIEYRDEMKELLSEYSDADSEKEEKKIERKIASLKNKIEEAKVNVELHYSKRLRHKDHSVKYGDMED